MPIKRIPQNYIDNDGCHTPIKTALEKANELVDAVNDITDGEGTETFENITVTDTATIDTAEIATAEVEALDVNSATIAEGEITSLNSTDINISGTLVITKTAVTQLSTISTTVVANTQSGVITTVSSTLASNASATFTVTNSKVSASSMIQLTASTAGAGIPVASVNTIGSGTFNIRLYNAGSAALDNTVRIDFIVN
jgi:hypothetical protein